MAAGSRAESVVSPVPSGVARHWSVAYPGMESFVNNVVPVGTNGMNRLSSVNFNDFANGVGGAPPAPQGSTFYKGQVAWRITGGAAATRALEPVLSAVVPFQVYFQMVKGTAPMYGLDEFCCWRIAALMAFDNPAGAIAGDVGLSLCPGASIAIRAANQAGIEYGPRTTGNIGVTVRAVDAGALTFDANLAANFQPADMTDWHLYEMRIIGADVNAEAVIKFLIDGVTCLTLPWGAGTVLPVFPDVANRLGFHPGIQVRAPVAAGYGMWLAMPGGWMMSAGPTEDSLL
jgi:hypothetical protein